MHFNYTSDHLKLVAEQNPNLPAVKLRHLVDFLCLQRVCIPRPPCVNALKKKKKRLFTANSSLCSFNEISLNSFFVSDEHAEKKMIKTKCIIF